MKKTHNQIQQCSGQRFFVTLFVNEFKTMYNCFIKDNVEFLELQNFYATYILTRSKCGNSRDAPTSSIKKTCSLYSNVLCKKSQWTPCLGPVYSRTEGDLVSPYT